MGLKIDLSPIEHKLPKAAFDLFRTWTKDIGIASTLEIKDERLLVVDLKDAIQNATLHLLKKEDRAWKPMGWDIGFVLGFIGGSLGTKWHHEYIIKKSTDYKIYNGLRAIRGYLELNHVAKIKVDDIYLKLLDHDSNFRNVDGNIVQLDLNEETIESEETDEKGTIDTILRNLILKQVFKYSKMNNSVDLDVSSVFSAEEIRVLIDLNEY